MQNVKKLLDDAKAATGNETDYGLAKSLGLPKQRISDYYKGDRVPDEFACLKIAEALDMPLAKVIATVKAEAEKDEKRREEWRCYLKKLGGLAASLALAVCVNVILEMTPLARNALAASVSGTGHFVLCKIIQKIRAAAGAASNRLYIWFRRVCSRDSPSGGILA